MTAKKYIRNGRPYWKARLIRNFQYLGLFIFFTVYIINSSTLLKELFLNWWNTPTTIVLAAEPVTVMPVSATITPTLSPVMSTERDEESEEIKELIKEVFGEHSDKAFKLLSCENAKLNPKAINTAGNTPKGSKDIGVFQINEYWQGVNAKFLLDPELNIRIAYKIFKDNGYSFERWTCGRKLNI